MGHSFTSRLDGTFSVSNSHFDCSVGRSHLLNPHSQLRSLATMAPIASTPMEIVDQMVATNRVMVFSKTTCPFCTKIKNMFEQMKAKIEVLELDQIPNRPEVQAALLGKTGQKTVPNVFINQKHVGGHDDTMKLAGEEKMLPMINADNHNFDYDIIVIGGGSGGLAASKEAASLGKKVAVLDFVKPSPAGSSWGLGGTCVNVGCIPKKLMHQAGLLGEAIEDAKKYGWQVEKPKHDWNVMVQAIQDYIGGLNWGYKVELRDKQVKYINAYGYIQDKNTIKTTNKRGKEEILTTDKILVATGERPRY